MNLNQMKKTLVLDIETASLVKCFDDLSARMKSFWEKKSMRLIKDHSEDKRQEVLSDLYDRKAAIFAEFARVVCISVGIFEVEDEIKSFRIKSFYGDNEKQILDDFSELVNAHFYDKYNHTIAGHNLKEFDIPFLCRRMVIHKMKLPNLMRLYGSRPWQVPHLLDTLDLWKFGDYKNFSSLDLLCEVLSIPTPKDNMNGSEVSQAFWDGKVEEIKEYCEKDVLACARLILRLMGAQEIEDEKVFHV